MTVMQSIITILAVALGTMLTRFLPLVVFPDSKNPPQFITYLGTVFPYAVIGLLVAYSLKDFVGTGSHGIPEILAILFITAVHRWKKNMLLSISAGTVLYMFFVQAVF